MIDRGLNELYIFVVTFSKQNAFARFIKTLMLLLIIIALATIADSMAGIITLGRLERQVNLLKEMHALTEIGLGNQQDLVNLYNYAVSGLNEYNPNLMPVIKNLFPANSPLEKPTAGEKILPTFAIWLLFAGAVARSMGKEHVRIMRQMIFILIALAGLGWGLVANLFLNAPGMIGNVVLSMFWGISPLILLLGVELQFNVFGENTGNPVAEETHVGEIKDDNTKESSKEKYPLEEGWTKGKDPGGKYDVQIHCALVQELLHKYASLSILRFNGSDTSFGSWLIAHIMEYNKDFNCNTNERKLME